MEYDGGVAKSEGIGGSTPNPATPLDRIFEDRLLVPMAEVAAALEIDVKTLRRHVHLGNIVPVILGFGLSRPRRLFTRVEVQRFVDGRSRRPSVDPLPEPDEEMHRQARERARGQMSASRGRTRR